MALYSIIIPVYKSSDSLKIIVSELSKMQTELGYKFEIIFVNDSPFFLETVNMLGNLRIGNDNVKIVTFRKNQGQHIATLAGINIALGDFIITMDDDLQHPVSELPKLIEGIQTSNAEGVFAIPNYRNRKHSFWRSVASYLLKKSDSIFLEKPKGLILSSYRIMTKDLAQATLNSYNAMPAVSSLMVNASNNLINVKVKHTSREFGETNYTFSKLLSLALNGILYYSSLPLRILGIVGIIGFLGSMLFIISIIFRKLAVGIDFPGYASTVTLISFFGGLNLFAFGIIGEYLLRIIKEQQKPNLKDLIK
ncbi:glycosyltransferase [Gillisia hiemivivida]|uniref:Glycosyltransferase n=1 Tax=Gillisia hiemivivida TaxID=291190 RepID=A0A5C6ZVG1_9FLAO|nr:glycosyltransferase [Gillisia hiemivivida]TXD92869.1 glycosyltransferase [Gillisia hiemivivida]